MSAHEPKVTGAPDEIWLVYGELEHDDTHENCYREGEVTWCQDPQYGSDIRYLRADLFEAIAAQPKPAPVLLTDDELVGLHRYWEKQVVFPMALLRQVEAAVLKKNGIET